MTRRWTSPANSSRSTASAAPPGTLAESAHGSKRLPSALSSDLRSPCALVSSTDLKGFARRARPAIGAMGRGSNHRPRLEQPHPNAALRERRAASEPARPPTKDSGLHARPPPRARRRSACSRLEAGSLSPIDLVDLLLHSDPATIGTGIGYRAVPGGEVARGVSRASPERLATLGPPLSECARDTWGTFIPSGMARVPLQFGYVVQARNSPKRPVLMIMGEPHGSTSRRWDGPEPGPSSATSRSRKSSCS